MPRFHITQHRDATQFWYALIDASSKAEAHRRAEADDCIWIAGPTTQCDDRRIPLDEIVRVDDDFTLLPRTVRTRIWLLTLDNGSDEPSTDIYSLRSSALIAFEVALSPYLSPEERETYKGDPIAASRILEDRTGGFPYGDICRLSEHTLEVIPDP